MSPSGTVFSIHHPRMLAARSSRVSRLQRLTRLMRIAALLPRITGLLQRGNRQLGPDLFKEGTNEAEKGQCWVRNSRSL